jgi:RES domain-containing protein
VIGGFYLADSPNTAWAEWQRQLAELGLRPEHQLPRDLWRLRVDLDRVADLSDAARLAKVALSPPSASRLEWPQFQVAGEQLHAEGWRGILAPSAARPEGRVLCLFREAETIEGVKPIPPPAFYRNPPRPPANTRADTPGR